MNDDDLRGLIEDLRAEIERLGPADDEARARLGSLVADIERRIEEPHDEAAHADLMDLLRQNVERFEVEHPRATGIVNHIMVMLGNIGI